MAKLRGSFGIRVLFVSACGNMFGVVKKFSFWSIRVETLEEKPSTCLRMYRRKASLDHLPMIMIVNVGTLERYMAMAAPERRECVPISFSEKPRASLPSVLAVHLREFLMVVEVSSLGSCDCDGGRNRFTFDSGLALG